MLWRKGRFVAHRRLLSAVYLLALAMAVVPAQSALALIEGGEGNNPLDDPGWPNGAARVFNHPGRVAYWVGPPFGGGQWHAECRGDATVLNAVLADFAKIDAKTKRVVVHDGVGRSFWLNPNRDKAKEPNAKIDWKFMVWQSADWEHLRRMPADLRPTDAGDADPPVQIDIYSGNLRWAEVTIPAGLKVVDNHLEAHGFLPSDGVVLEGLAVDLDTQTRIALRGTLCMSRPKGARRSENGEAPARSTRRIRSPSRTCRQENMFSTDSRTPVRRRKRPSRSRWIFNGARRRRLRFAPSEGRWPALGYRCR